MLITKFYPSKVCRSEVLKIGIVISFNDENHSRHIELLSKNGNFSWIDLFLSIITQKIIEFPSFSFMKLHVWPIFTSVKFDNYMSMNEKYERVSMNNCCY